MIYRLDHVAICPLTAEMNLVKNSNPWANVKFKGSKAGVKSCVF
jgi:hypothetical protein